MIKWIMAMVLGGLLFVYGIFPVMEKEIVSNSVMEYYDCLCDIFQGDDIEELYQLMDMESVQSQNVVRSMKCLVFSVQYMEEMTGQVRDRYNIPYSISVTGFEKLTADTCKLTIHMKLDEDIIYPTFLANGDEVFILKREGNRWLISEHIWAGISVFELSRTEYMGDLDYNLIMENLDSIITSGLSQ